jgi:hypothetical protein
MSLCIALSCINSYTYLKYYLQSNGYGYTCVMSRAVRRVTRSLASRRGGEPQPATCAGAGSDAVAFRDLVPDMAQTTLSLWG